MIRLGSVGPDGRATGPGGGRAVGADGVRLQVDLYEDRYSRLRLLPWWDQDRLRRSHVLVVGAGALGNEIVKNLALVGIGRLTIVDMDVVEHSNLSRSVLFRAADEGKPKAAVAAARACELNPDVRAAWIQGSIIDDVGMGLFRSADVVAAGVDNREARLAINQKCWRVGVPWVDGAIEALSGVARVFVPPAGACYECTLDGRDYELMARRRTCALLSRDEMLSGKVPTTPTSASIVAAIQVQEVLKLLHRDRGLAVLEGRGFIYYGHLNDAYVVTYPRREDCLSHDPFPSVRVEPWSARTATPAALIEASRRAGHDPMAPAAEPTRSREVDGPPSEHPPAPENAPARASWAVELPGELCLAARCRGCRVERPLRRPLRRLTHRDVACPGCGEVMELDLTHTVSEGSWLAGYPLIELGVPLWDIVTVVGPHGQRFHWELAADRAELLSQA